MKLHALTACTRPDNLPTIARSLEPDLSCGIDLTWHVRFDPDRLAVGGQALKNAMLDDIADGWIWICDDDNQAHPAFFETLMAMLADNGDVRLIVCAQQHQSGWIRRVNRGMLKASHVDAGQIVARRDAIGEHRIPEHYCGDGEFIQALADSLTTHQIMYVHHPVVFYNWLRSDS
jgi:hypothetical protein